VPRKNKRQIPEQFRENSERVAAGEKPVSKKGKRKQNSKKGKKVKY
jgi:hypothetical protein